MHFTGNTELITPEAITKIIAYNQSLCEQRGKSFRVRREILEEIRRGVNAGSDIVNTKDRMARRAANLLSGFALGLPFDYENVSTGMALVVDYLKRNGFMISSDVVRELYKIVRNNISNAKMRDKLEIYLRNNLKS